MQNENQLLESQGNLEKEKALEYAQALKMLEDYSDTPEPEKRRESGPEVSELKALITAFEQKHSIEDLFEMTSDGSKITRPLRESAKDALVPILKKLQTLKKETDISPEKLVDLFLDYRRFSSAVGMVNVYENDLLHEVIE